MPLTTWLPATPLDSLIKQHWERTMSTNSESASQIGDKRFNDRLDDYTQAAVDADVRAATDFLQRFKAINATGFPAQDKLNRELLISDNLCCRRSCARVATSQA